MQCPFTCIQSLVCLFDIIEAVDNMMAKARINPTLVLKRHDNLTNKLNIYESTSCTDKLDTRKNIDDWYITYCLLTVEASLVLVTFLCL